MTTSPSSTTADTPERFERLAKPLVIATCIGLLIALMASVDWLLGVMLCVSFLTPAVSGPVALSTLGIVASLFGVYLATRIFITQAANTRKESETNEQRLTNNAALLEDVRAIAERTHAAVAGVDAKLSRVAREQDTQPDDDEQPSSEQVDVDVSDEGEASTGGRLAYLNGEEREVFEALKVPLWVLNEVINNWTEVRFTGRWDVSSLVGAYRNRSSDGSFRGQPWTLVFEHPDKGELEAWSVYRGGYAKKTATVSATDLPKSPK